MATFKTGNSYSTRSICEHDHVISITIAGRTKCFVKTTEGKRLKVTEYNGAETVMPWGSYSMAPTITAEDK